MKRQWILVIFLVGLLSACSIGQVNESVNGQDVLPPEEDQVSALELAAEAALIDFYHQLNQGEYEKAVELYAGSYEELEYFNPGWTRTTRRACWLRLASSTVFSACRCQA
jgi:hypothetical protein